ncbi:RNase A-like domain-containing protein [Streptomyces sp. M-16]|uniref:RNase A-like domain-containing protein n=1 Tax=Streptomyces sp. M-16 TaxID=3233040 RepID=UPI003F998BDA
MSVPSRRVVTAVVGVRVVDLCLFFEISTVANDQARLGSNGRKCEWLASPKGQKMDFAEEFDEATGLSLTRENFKRGTAAQWVNGVQVVLKRDPSAANGYRILTSYPIP